MFHCCLNLRVGKGVRGNGVGQVTRVEGGGGVPRESWYGPDTLQQRGHVLAQHLRKSTGQYLRLQKGCASSAGARLPPLASSAVRRSTLERTRGRGTSATRKVAAGRRARRLAITCTSVLTGAAAAAARSSCCATSNCCPALPQYLPASCVTVTRRLKGRRRCITRGEHSQEALGDLDRSAGVDVYADQQLRSAVN